jgi:hypothetical protein
MAFGPAVGGNRGLRLAPRRRLRGGRRAPDPYRVLCADQDPRSYLLVRLGAACPSSYGERDPVTKDPTVLAQLAYCGVCSRIHHHTGRPRREEIRVYLLTGY